MKKPQVELVTQQAVQCNKSTLQDLILYKWGLGSFLWEEPTNVEPCHTLYGKIRMCRSAIALSKHNAPKWWNGRHATFRS